MRIWRTRIGHRSRSITLEVQMLLYSIVLQRFRGCCFLRHYEGTARECLTCGTDFGSWGASESGPIIFGDCLQRREKAIKHHPKNIKLSKSKRCKSKRRLRISMMIEMNVK